MGATIQGVSCCIGGADQVHRACGAITQGRMLQPGRQVWGFPTPDGDDGKLLTVNGPGNATLEYKSATLWVSFPPTTADISIEVFDGDVGGFNDRLEPASACYALTSDKWADGMGSDVVVELPGSEFRDNAWTALYRGPLPKTGSACITGGDCWYRIDVELGSEGACSSQSRVAAKWAHDRDAQSSRSRSSEMIKARRTSKSTNKPGQELAHAGGTLGKASRRAGVPARWSNR